jgi:hypothetical protein
MSRRVFTEGNYGPAMPWESGLETVQVSPDSWPMGAPARIPRAAIWAMDPHRGALETDFQSALESAFRPYPRGEIAFPFPGRVFLVAVRKDVAPPVQYGNSVLQHMRVVMAEPGAGIDADEYEAIAGQTWPTPARPVKGEILRDEQGRLYEKTGNLVRPLHKLATSRDGDLIELNAQQEKAPACRKLFPDPGQWRVVRWGEFKSLLAGQVAHPERLRDNHRLACYVQVMETSAPQHVETIAATLLGDAQVAGELLMLTDSLAERLELTTLLAPKPRIRGAAREPGVILPSDRLFRLQVAADPTLQKGAGEAERPAEKKEPPDKVGRAPRNQTPLKKTAVPDRFLKNEFALSREEALFDMRMKPSLALRFERWRNSLGKNAEFQKWQRLLWGKELEEQLWSVRPPKHMLTHERIRDWAQCTLEAAGYDVSQMLHEWEIYWRRKGF